MVELALLPRRKQIRERKPPTFDEKVRALWDFWAFVDLINFHGGSVEFGECHRELVSWSEEHGGLKELILMPRGHLKSTIKTVAETLWLIYQNPNIRIFVGTATKGLATAFVREIKTYLEDDWLKEYVWDNRPHIEGRLIPLKDKLYRVLEETEAEDKKILWRGDAFQVVRSQILKEPTVTIGSVGVQPTGYHYDILKMDDVINFDNISPLKKEKVMAWIHDLFNVLDPPYVDEEVIEHLQCADVPQYHIDKICVIGGRVTVVGTRYDREDWYAEIMAKKNSGGYQTYKKNIYKNGQDRTDGYLWHEQWNEATEQDKRENMTAIRFASQYLNEILVPEDQILDTEKFNPIHFSDIELLMDGYVNIKVRGKPDPVKVKLFLTIDPAAATSATADFTAMTVGGRDKDRNLYVVDFKMGRWKSTFILKYLFELADKWKLRAVTIESVGGFKHLVEFIRASFDKYRPIGIIEFQPKGDKVTRISNALEPLVANSMIYMNIDVLRYSQEARDQINFFPRETMHDDFPDALAILAEIARPIKARTVNQYKNHINTRYGGVR